MKCDSVQLPSGVSIIACSSRGARKKCECCTFGNVATKQCDFPLLGAKEGRTCSKYLCDACASRTVDGRDMCPAHLRELGRAAIAAHDADDWLSRLEDAPVEPAPIKRGADADADDWLASLDAPIAPAPHAWFCRAGDMPGEPCECDAPSSSPARTTADERRAKIAQSQPLDEKVRHVRRASQIRAHGCHWPGCKAQCKPAQWGCTRHWFMLPKQLRDRIWNEYRAGQEETLTPSRAYLEVVREAEAWILVNHPPVDSPQAERARMATAIERVSLQEATEQARERDARRAPPARRDSLAESVRMVAVAFGVDPEQAITTSEHDNDPRDPRDPSWEPDYSSPWDA